MNRGRTIRPTKQSDMEKEKMTKKELKQGLLFALLVSGVLVTAECWWLCLVFVVLLGVVASKMK